MPSKTLPKFKVGDRAIFKGETWGKEEWHFEMNKRYGGDTCTILETRGTPFDDCKVAFDSFPNCNHREYHNWFFVSQDSLVLIDKTV